MKEARTIDEVVEHLTEIIGEASRQGSPVGYFPALYRKVTLQVKRGIDDGFFDDGPRMERLDVRFANRYLAALHASRMGDPLSDCWRAAFVATDAWSPIVLQHLLLGMNAHINLDLGIAAARTAPGSALRGLRDDFNRINEILSGLVGGVKEELGQVWPTLRLFNRYLGDVETGVITFRMSRARDEAWRLATRLSDLGEDRQAAEISRLDADVTKLAGLIRHPGFVVGSVLRVVRLGERGSVARKIAILE